MPLDRRSAWGLRLFGVRELVLALGLARAYRSREAGEVALMADLVSASQLGDMAVAGTLLWRGEFSRRAAALVWLGALPTLLVSLRLAAAARAGSAEPSAAD